VTEEKLDKKKAPPREFKRVERGSKTHVHDLFKLGVSTMKKNVSYRFQEPKLLEMEHSHFYHSINDSTLQANKYCSPVGGHAHEITMLDVPDENGHPQVKVGPAIELVVKKIAGGRTIRRWEPVRFATNEDGEVKYITDTHTHEVEYKHSEEFSEQTRTKARLEERSKVSELMRGEPVSTQAGRQAGLQSGASTVGSVLQEAPPSRPGT
jgi:hypothetical protein